MSPRIRPRSTDRSIPSSATVLFRKIFLSPLASMQAIASALPFCFAAGTIALDGRQQLFGREPEALNGFADRRPFLVEKSAALGIEQEIADVFPDVHAKPAALLDQLLVNELLIGLEHRERIDPILCRHIPNGRQRIALLEVTLENHRHHPVSEPAIDRLAVVPFAVHCVRPSSNRVGWDVACTAVIVKYYTTTKHHLQGILSYVADLQV